MREIKFRAWHKTWSAQDIDKSDWHSPNQKINGMQSVKSLGYSSHGNFWVHLEDWSSACSAADVHLMQFTGLRDKNGTDIYGGDIFKVANNQKYEIVWLEELEYDEKCAGWGLRQLNNEISPYLIDTFAINNGEVIGNIYENPELVGKYPESFKSEQEAETHE